MYDLLSGYKICINLCFGCGIGNFSIFVCEKFCPFILTFIIFIFNLVRNEVFCDRRFMKINKLYSFHSYKKSRNSVIRDFRFPLPDCNQSENFIQNDVGTTSRDSDKSLGTKKTSAIGVLLIRCEWRKPEFLYRLHRSSIFILPSVCFLCQWIPLLCFFVQDDTSNKALQKSQNA